MWPKDREEACHDDMFVSKVRQYWSIWFRNYSKLRKKWSEKSVNKRYAGFRVNREPNVRKVNEYTEVGFEKAAEACHTDRKSSVWLV